MVDSNVESYEELLSPSRIIEKIPLSEDVNEFVLETRDVLRRIIDGEDKRKILIVGPCSIHNYDSAKKYALKLKELQDKVKDKILILMRTYFEKPRTSLGWKGMLYDPDLVEKYDIEKGLIESRKLLLEINELGLGCATEFLNVITPQYIGDLISWAAIGARTTESQLHREMASGLSMPVGFKNNVLGDILPAINAIKSSKNPHSFLGISFEGKISKVKTKGNEYCNIILRGGEKGPNYSSEDVFETIGKLRENSLNEKIFVDCSHGNSDKNPLKQSEVLENISGQIKDGNESIIGLMIESNLKEGNQKIGSDVDPEVSITDAGLGWEDTERAILDFYEKLK